MIQSLFILSPTGEVIIERHFRGVLTPRSVCLTFWEAASESINHHGGVSAATSLLGEQLYDTVPPVIDVETDDGDILYIVSILRDGLSYLAVCPAETSPLSVLELLGKIHSIFLEYFGVADEPALKDNFSTVYQLLEEMIDYGTPLTTEFNSLKAMILPPSVMSTFLPTSNVGENLPSETISNKPWRAENIYYSNNEFFMDIVEQVDAIVNSSGTIVSSDVHGSVQCQSRLSGMPDLLLTFKEPALIEDCSFHPCVRYLTFEKDQVVSFIPPDGNFELMKYRISNDKARNLNPPIYCHAQWSIDQESRPVTSSASGKTDQQKGLLVLQLGVSSLSSLVFSASRKGPLEVEEVAVTIPFPKQTRSSQFQVNIGNVIYDEAAKVARWTLGTMDSSKKASFSCTCTARNEKDNSTLAAPNVSVSWKIPLSSVSGIAVSGLTVRGEGYTPYKGTRNITRSGLFQVRCN